MDVTKVIKERRSIRRFSKKSINDDIILGALDAALWAPSAGNVQDKEFIVIRNDKTKESLVEAVFEQNWVAHAPVIIILLSNLSKLRLKFSERAEFYSLVGGGASLENMLLYLTSEGLQGTHVGLFDELVVKRVLGVPDDRRVISIIALGYPAEKPPVPQRIELRNVTFFENYGDKWIKNVPRETYLH